VEGKALNLYQKAKFVHARVVYINVRYRYNLRTVLYTIFTATKLNVTSFAYNE
jgi:hypothetical protein